MMIASPLGDLFCDSFIISFCLDLNKTTHASSATCCPHWISNHHLLFLFPRLLSSWDLPQRCWQTLLLPLLLFFITGAAFGYPTVMAAVTVSWMLTAIQSGVFFWLLTLLDIGTDRVPGVDSCLCMISPRFFFSSSVSFSNCSRISVCFRITVFYRSSFNITYQPDMTRVVLAGPFLAIFTRSPSLWISLSKVSIYTSIILSFSSFLAIMVSRSSCHIYLSSKRGIRKSTLSVSEDYNVPSSFHRLHSRFLLICELGILSESPSTDIGVNTLASSWNLQRPCKYLTLQNIHLAVSHFFLTCQVAILLLYDL